MSLYTNLIKSIKEFDISKSSAFDAVLNKASQSGRRTWKYGDAGADAEEEICEKFCRGLIEVAEKLGSLYEGLGIQKFSLNVNHNIKEEDVKKALFLSQKATMFTPHEFSYCESKDVTIDEPTEYHTFSWSISHNYLRQIYNFKEAILNEGLVILPSSIKYCCVSAHVAHIG